MKKNNGVTEKLNKLEARVIGQVGVDAGLIWIGDPCYIINREEERKYKSLGKTWGDFCELLGNKSYKSFNYDAGHEGLGVCTSTKHGDGCYNVIGFFEKGAESPSCVMVDFDEVYYYSPEYDTDIEINELTDPSERVNKAHEISEGMER